MTLPETLLAIALVGTLAGLAVPRARHGLDTVRVRGARDAAYGVASRARTLAVAHGGADLIVDLPGKSLAIADASGAILLTASVHEFEVDLFAAGSGSRVVLHYDSRGIGRMASQTLRLRRGAAEAGLTFSSFGRVRRW